MKQILVVTHNKYKRWEFQKGFRRYLSEVDVAFKSQKLKESLCVSPERNTRNKALQAFQRFKTPLLVDDTIFLFKRYNNFPGIHTKWLMDSIGIKGILRLIEKGDEALFRSYLGFYDGETFKIFKGEIKGQLQTKINPKKIQKGLDYSAFFIPEGKEMPMADFYKSYTYLNSHRMKAIRKFSGFFREYYGYH